MWETLPSIFRGLDERQLEAVLGRFRLVEVEPGVPLIQEGDVDPTLVVVQAGQLVISTGGTKLGTAVSGDIIGEIALFTDGMRTANVTTSTHVRLLVLDAGQYETLRAMNHPVSLAIEERALELLIERLRSVSKRIAGLSKGSDDAYAVPEPGFFDKVATAIGSGGIVFPGRLDAAKVLKKSRLFAAVPDEYLAELGKCFYVVAARRGEFLCTEGETGNDMYVLADGQVDVVVATGSDHIQHLGTLGPGEAFGMVALLDPTTPRMASCIARETISALSIGKIKYAEVINRADMVGSVFRVAMIRSLADQISYANGQLAMFDMRREQDELADPANRAELRRNTAAALEAGRYQIKPEDVLPDYLVGK